MPSANRWKTDYFFNKNKNETVNFTVSLMIRNNFLKTWKIYLNFVMHTHTYIPGSTKCKVNALFAFTLLSFINEGGVHTPSLMIVMLENLPVL